MARLFVDMDGVLAKWKPAKIMEQICEKNWFLSMDAQTNVVDAIRGLAEDGEEVYILSAGPESEYAVIEKNAWLDNVLPEIGVEHRIFSRLGRSKTDFVPLGVQPDDVLLDDYSANLHDWSGIGVKVLNGVNGSNGTWAARGGRFVKADWPSWLIRHRIKEAIQ